MRRRPGYDQIMQIRRLPHQCRELDRQESLAYVPNTADGGHADHRDKAQLRRGRRHPNTATHNASEQTSIPISTAAQ